MKDKTTKVRTAHDCLHRLTFRDGFNNNRMPTISLDQLDNFAIGAMQTWNFAEHTNLLLHNKRVC